MVTTLVIKRSTMILPLTPGNDETPSQKYDSKVILLIITIQVATWWPKEINDFHGLQLSGFFSVACGRPRRSRGPKTSRNSQLLRQRKKKTAKAVGNSGNSWLFQPLKPSDKGRTTRANLNKNHRIYVANLTERVWISGNSMKVGWVKGPTTIFLGIAIAVSINLETFCCHLSFAKRVIAQQVWWRHPCKEAKV